MPGLSLRDLPYRPGEALHFRHGVVMHRANPHHAAVAFQPQVCADVEGVVVAVPHVNPALAKLLRHGMRVLPLEPEGIGRHTLLQPPLRCSAAMPCLSRSRRPVYRLLNPPDRSAPKVVPNHSKYSTAPSTPVLPS